MFFFSQFCLDWYENLLGTYVSVKCLSLRLFLPQLGVWLCCVHTVTLLRNLLLYIMHLKSPPETGERKKERERGVMSEEEETVGESVTLYHHSFLIAIVHIVSITANQYCI